MGTHPSKAKRVLSGIVEHYGEIVFQDTPEAADIIGMAIQEVRNRDELKRIKKLIRD